MDKLTLLRSIFNSASPQLKQNPLVQKVIFYLNTSNSYDEFLNKIHPRKSFLQSIGEGMVRAAQAIEENKPPATSLSNEISRFGRDVLSGGLNLIGLPLSGKITWGEAARNFLPAALGGILPSELLYYSKNTPIIGGVIKSIPFLEYSSSLGEATARDYPRLSKVMAGIQAVSPIFNLLKGLSQSAKVASILSKEMDKAKSISQRLRALREGTPIIKNVSKRILNLMKSGITTGAEMLGWNWEQPFVNVISGIKRSQFVQKVQDFIQNDPVGRVVKPVVEPFLPATDVGTANILEKVLKDKYSQTAQEFLNVAPEPQYGTVQYTNPSTAPNLFEKMPFTKSLMENYSEYSLGKVIGKLLREGDFKRDVLPVLKELKTAGFDLPLNRQIVGYYIKKFLKENGISPKEFGKVVISPELPDKIVNKLSAKKRVYLENLIKVFRIADNDNPLGTMFASQIDKMKVPRWEALFDYTHKAHILDAIGWNRPLNETEAIVSSFGTQRIGATISRKLISKGVEDVELRTRHFINDVMKKYSYDIVTQKLKNKSNLSTLIQKAIDDEQNWTAKARFRDLTFSNMLASPVTFMANFLSAVVSAGLFTITHPKQAFKFGKEWVKGIKKEFANLWNNLKRIWGGKPYYMEGMIRHAENVVDIFSNIFERKDRKFIYKYLTNHYKLSPNFKKKLSFWVVNGDNIPLMDIIEKEPSLLNEIKKLNIDPIINMESNKTVSRLLHSYQNIVSTMVKAFDDTLADAIVKVTTKELIDVPKFRQIVKNITDAGEKLSHYYSTYLLPTLVPPNIYAQMKAKFPKTITALAPFFRFGSSVLSWNMLTLLYFLSKSPQIVLNTLPRLGAILSTWGIEGFILFNQGKAEMYYSLPYAYDKGVGLSVPLSKGRVLYISFSQIPIINGLIGWMSFLLPKPARERKNILINEVLNWAGFRWILGGYAFELMKYLTGLTTEREKYVSPSARLGRVFGFYGSSLLYEATGLISPFRNTVTNALLKFLPILSLMPRITRKVWSATPQTQTEREAGKVYVKTEQSFIDGIMTQSWLLTLLSSIYEMDEGKPLIDKRLNLPRENLRAPENLAEWIGYMVNIDVFKPDVYREYKLTANLRSDLIRWIKDAPTFEEWQRRLQLANHYFLKEAAKNFPKDIYIKALMLKDKAMMPILPSEALPKAKNPSTKKLFILRDIYFQKIKKAG